MITDWIKSSEELPGEDEMYEICNYPEAENDGIRREMTATAYYDGYGFQYLGVYRDPLYWRNYKRLTRKYGIQDGKEEREKRT